MHLNLDNTVMVRNVNFLQCSKLMRAMSEELDDWLFANGYDELLKWLCGKKLGGKLNHFIKNWCGFLREIFTE